MNALVTAVEPKGSWFHGQPDRDVLDAFLVQQKPAWPNTKFHRLGDAWRPCSWKEAQDLIEALTTKTMAYGASFEPDWSGPVTPREFLSHFSGDARLYTNVQMHDAWMPATSSTFDRGVAAIDDASIGIFWAQDED